MSPNYSRTCKNKLGVHAKNKASDLVPVARGSVVNLCVLAPPLITTSKNNHATGRDGVQ